MCQGRVDMDSQILSGIAFFGSAAVLMALFEIVERYDSSRLFWLLTNPQRFGRAMWLLNISAALFAHGTALKAMGHLLERNQQEILSASRDVNKWPRSYTTSELSEAD